MPEQQKPGHVAQVVHAVCRARKGCERDLFNYLQEQPLQADPGAAAIPHMGAGGIGASVCTAGWKPQKGAVIPSTPTCIGALPNAAMPLPLPLRACAGGQRPL
jgi:hypothetical protein